MSSHSATARTRRHTVPRLFSAAVLATVLGVRAGHAQVIDTRTGESIGAVTLPHFGQSFTVPDGATALVGFSFVFASNGSLPSTVRGVLMRWDGSQGVGPVRYASASRLAGPCCQLLEEAFVTNLLPVSAGEQYVAFIEQMDGTVVHGIAAIDDAFVDSYAGGRSVQTSCTTTVVVACGWGSAAWDRDFVARFNSTTVVPEPRSVMLLASGGASCLALVARRRRRGRSC
jgi:hypothetical protein